MLKIYLTQPCAETEAFTDGIDEDHTAQNVHSDLGSVPSVYTFQCMI